MSQIYVGDRIACTDLEGPGNRYALFLAGCSIRCPGCCNPHLFVARERQQVPVQNLAREILNTPNIEGVSVLGGEPLDQAVALLSLLQELSPHLSIMLYSGFYLSDIRKMELGSEILSHCDLLVDGPYIKEKHSHKRRFIGSENQTLHFLSERYQPKDPRFLAQNMTEFRLSKDSFRILGFPP